MASIAFPSFAKTTTLSDGTTYGYAAADPSSPEKVTFLFLHGYPSSSFDWRHQINSLSAAGYGVIAPDLLGYGDTDKPVEIEAYRLKTMSKHIAEILDAEGVSRCVAVSHDWGSGLISRLVSYIPERLHAIVPISVGYIAPGLVWDIDALNQFSKGIIGYGTYGYWSWHNTEEAISDCDNHPASTFTLIYAAEAKAWLENLAPDGAAEKYVKNGKVDALPSWYSLSDYTTRDRIFAQSGYRGPLSWYKAAMRGVNLDDEAAIPEDARACNLPVLLIVSTEDYVTRADLQTMGTQQSCPNLQVETIEGCGHWIMLEQPEKVCTLLMDFAAKLRGN